MTELAYWLALHHAPGIGSITYKKLLDHCGSAKAVFDQIDDLKLKRASRDFLKNPDWAAVESDLTWQEKESCHSIITLHDANYPSQLKEIADPPAVLYLQGDSSLLHNTQIAIVGSRNPTPPGQENSWQFANSLTHTGLTITSGLALGIDGAAHKGALQNGGTTIAVTATGLDRVYPARHRKLAHEIVEKGLIISEMPIGTPPKPQYFPRRNRIISGLSAGTLVVEAARNSGSLITARLALEQNREVFAIPGSIHNPLARGCHDLLRQGAKLVETVQDITEELGLITAEQLTKISPTLQPDKPKLDQKQSLLLNSIGFEPIHIDQLIEHSGLTTEEVSSMILFLELDGHVSTAPGGMYIRNS